MVKAKGRSDVGFLVANTLQTGADPLPCLWLKVSLGTLDEAIADRRVAGAEFAELLLQAAFGGKKVKTVQAYINLDADAGGKGVQKEIGSDLEYFSVNIELGVSFPTRSRDRIDDVSGYLSLMVSRKSSLLVPLTHQRRPCLRLLSKSSARASRR